MVCTEIFKKIILKLKTSIAVASRAAASTAEVLYCTSTLSSSKSLKTISSTHISFYPYVSCGKGTDSRSTSWTFSATKATSLVALYDCESVINFIYWYLQ